MFCRLVSVYFKFNNNILNTQKRTKKCIVLALHGLKCYLINFIYLLLLQINSEVAMAELVGTLVCQISLCITMAVSNESSTLPKIRKRAKIDGSGPSEL